MFQVIPFPLRSRAHLVRSLAGDLETVHGDAANQLWRSRIAALVAELRGAGRPDDAIRHEVIELQNAVQMELQQRSLARANAGSVA